MHYITSHTLCVNNKRYIPEHLMDMRHMETLESTTRMEYEYLWKKKSRYIIEHLKNISLKQSTIYYGTSHEYYYTMIISCKYNENSCIMSVNLVVIREPFVFFF